MLMTYHVNKLLCQIASCYVVIRNQQARLRSLDGLINNQQRHQARSKKSNTKVMGARLIFNTFMCELLVERLSNTIGMITIDFKIQSKANKKLQM